MPFLKRINQLISLPESKAASAVFWKGAFIGLLSMCLVIMTLSGTFYRTGIPTWIIATGTLITGIIAFWLFRIIGALIHKGLTRLSTFVFSVLIATVLTLLLARVIRFGLPDQVFYPGAFIFILAFIFLFGSGLMLIKRASSHRNIHIVSVALSLLSIASCIYFLAQEGNDPYKIEYKAVEVPLLSEKGITNPANTGPHQLVHFTYGSGTDKRRPEYNNEVKYVSKKVDASRLLPDWKGSKAKWRERFWGFGIKELPLNGRVWMPAEKKNCPMMLIVHGNHGMEEFSDPGYAYLGELLASRGFIVVSVDENFINATWSGDFRGKEMPLRGWLLLKHLEQWKEWTNNSQHELFEKADLNNIILAGHSRGGEAAPIAARFNTLPYFPDDANETFNFNFGIKGVIAIAPTDKRYERRISLENINYLSIQGSYDSDEASFFGYRQFQRITFSDTAFHFKSGLYIHGANHGQFNTVWGKYDGGAPGKWLLNTAPQITAEDQMQIARVYVSSFAEAVLNGKSEYHELFVNSATAKDWLPSAIMVNTYEDSRTEKLVTFEEDINLTTGTRPGTAITGEVFKIWREETLKFRDKDTQANNALVLGWAGDSISQKPSYEISFSPSIRINEVKSLMMALALGDPSDLKENSKDKDGKKSKEISELSFDIHLIDSADNKISIRSNQLKGIKPRLKVQFVKLKGLHDENFGSVWEPTLETFEFPIDRFNPTETGLFNIKKLVFAFDQGPQGILIIDDISLQKKF